MMWFFLAACCAAAWLGFRLFRIKRQLRGIAVQLKDRTDGKTEKKITVSLFDRDLTRLASVLNRSLDLQKTLRIEIQNSDRKLKDSIANLSHDLRTPLTSILGYLQLSRGPECTEEKRRDYLQIVEGKAHALKSMIDGLYELSVLEAKEMPLKRERLDLNLLVADLLAGQYQLFLKSGINLKVSLPDGPVWILGDSIACTRVLQNLINNAVRYAKGKAEIRLSRSGSFALFSICNPAPGLTEEDAGHLFERFYTADRSRNSGGSGLGLTIVKMLLKKMDGKIFDVSLKDSILCIQVGFRLAEAD